jgi:hypothetical protein
MVFSRYCKVTQLLLNFKLLSSYCHFFLLFTISLYTVCLKALQYPGSGSNLLNEKKIPSEQMS